MRRRRLAAWLMALPLMATGSQLAHAAAYRFVYPNAHVRWSALLSTGHAYMRSPGYVPLLVGMLGGAEIVGASWVFAGSLRRSMQRPVPAWAFALMPLVGFTLQEMLERKLAGSSLPWWVVLQPTFQVGLLLQLPFALVMYLVARVLLRAVQSAARAVRGSLPPAPRAVATAVVRRSTELALVRLRVLATGHAGRGPPLLAPPR